MGTGGQEMVRSNRSNRKLARNSFGKFGQGKEDYYKWGFLQEGFQFKTPDKQEVKALRERIKKEQRREKRLVWIILPPVVLAIFYVVRAFYF